MIWLLCLTLLFIIVCWCAFLYFKFVIYANIGIFWGQYNFTSLGHFSNLLGLQVSCVCLPKSYTDTEYWYFSFSHILILIQYFSDWILIYTSVFKNNTGCWILVFSFCTSQVSGHRELNACLWSINRSKFDFPLT